MNNILKDKYLRIIFTSTFAVFLFVVIFSIAVFKNISGPLIIHFDAFKGIDFIGGKIQIFGINFLALIMLVVNLFLADFIYIRERFLSYVISFSSLFLSILLLIIVAVINAIN
ncbi:hypothetical protein COV23_01920 [Candidatus Wolfebacteria bacterium CG10_big_fil_rev_8_21_14_0_10_31_9]|uniref:DUF1648 domain-containing protein n=1 Tax=Candidatus Wolfebacteria bacterium CG10_big_fil_rev_8_21_14_0_10_31_9 TaxID=1975070 RepID=A0A2H0RC69_9BACT|nr:MAG: hypothetical protein COV23_01920 [Candidatus Wolfebacteria bacterium CG10_big_fil_rev_8_21_14_0_10_31_9]